jgi:hypothetical protein
MGIAPPAERTHEQNQKTTKQNSKTIKTRITTTMPEREYYLRIHRKRGEIFGKWQATNYGVFDRN